MRKPTTNFLIDLLSLLIMLSMVATGLILRWILPPGTGGRRLLWGFGRHDWGDVHFYLACAIGVLLVVHVALHWSWVCAMSQRFLTGRLTDGRRHPVRRVWYGAAFLAAVALLVAGFLTFAASQVQVTRGGGLHGEHRDLTSMTIDDRPFADAAQPN